MPTIIDGYNLIFSCGLEGKKRTPQSLEKARARLISTVSASIAASERTQTTIVFDAKRLPIKETKADSIVHDIRILYAVDYDEADTLIEELIASHSTPKKLVVVSSDHRLQTAATRRKATAVDSDIWYDRLLSREANDRQLGRQANDDANEKQTDIESLQAVDWSGEFNADDTDISDLDDTTTENEGGGTFNPFPPGYGEDVKE